MMSFEASIIHGSFERPGMHVPKTAGCRKTLKTSLTQHTYRYANIAVHVIPTQKLMVLSNTRTDELMKGC